MAKTDRIVLEVDLQTSGAKTVKELRTELQAMSRELSGMEAGTDGYRKALDRLIDGQTALQTAIRAQRGEMDAAEGSYNDLSIQLRALTNVYKTVTDDMTRSQLSQRIADINTQLKDMDATRGVFGRNVGNYTESFAEALKTPQQELRALRKELAQMKQGTDEYNATFQRMVQLTHDVTEQQEMLRWSSADLGDMLSNLTGIANGFVGGFSAISGVMQLMGSGNEDLQKAMATSQAFLQVIQGLAQVEELGDRIRGFVSGITNYVKAQREAAAATDTTSTAVAGQGSAMTATSTATKAATASTTLFSKAMGGLRKALVTTGIGALVVALGYLLNLLGKGLGALWDWVSGANKAEERTEALKTGMEDLGQAIEDGNEAWDRQRRLMEALGATDEQVYQAQRKVLEQQLAQIRAMRQQQEAIAAEIGQRRLQKEMYDDFREGLEELREKEEEYARMLSDLDYDEYIRNVREAREENSRMAESHIRDMEAMEGAEWRYTDEGRRAYDAMFRAKAEMYRKDSEEYREVMREMVRFDRDQRERMRRGREQDSRDVEMTADNLKELMGRIYDETEENGIQDRLLDDFNTLTEAMYRGLITGEQYADLMERINSAADEDLTEVRGRKLQEWVDGERSALEETVTMMENAFAAKEMDRVLTYPDDYIEQWRTVYATQEAMYLEMIGNIRDSRDWTGYMDDLEKTPEYRMIMALQSEFGEITRNFRADVSNAVLDGLSMAREGFMAGLSRQETDITLGYQIEESRQNPLNGMQVNYLTLMQDRWEAEDEINGKRMQALIDYQTALESALMNENLTSQARLQIEAEAANTSMEIARMEADEIILQNQRKAEATQNYVSAVTSSLQGISGILSNVEAAWETSIQAQIDAGEISEEEGERQFEKMKGLQSALALINALSSAVASYNSLASIPYVGPVLGAAAFAAALAAGIAQVVAINKTKIGDTSAGGSSSSSRLAEVTPQTQEYLPQGMTNITGGQEMEQLGNAINQQPIWVSVQDISSRQSKVSVRDRESTF